jgi:CRP-like cAMP-binding protein
VNISAITGSNLLGALRPVDLELLAPHIEPLDMARGDIIHEPGDTVRYAYFPRDEAVASYIIMLANGATVETAMVGREGALGGVVSQGRLPAFARACVMHPGRFFRMPIARLKDAKDQSPAIGHLFTRYADCLIAQIFQSVACNATHALEQRAAKWLCASVDRTGMNEVTLTQDQLGALLGVGRTYISRMVQRLRAQGAIRTRRGAIIVTDRSVLEQHSCECNLLITRHFDVVLHGVYPES